MEILNSCLDCDEIQFKEDGSWAPMRSKKEVQEVSASYNGIDGQSQLLLIRGLTVPLWSENPRPDPTRDPSGFRSKTSTSASDTGRVRY